MEANLSQTFSLGALRRSAVFETFQAAARAVALHWHDRTTGQETPPETQWEVGRLFHAYATGFLHWCRKVIPTGSGGTFAGNTARLLAAVVSSTEPPYAGTSPSETADADGNRVSHQGLLWLHDTNGLLHVQDLAGQAAATLVGGLEARHVPVKAPVRVGAYTTTAAVNVGDTHLAADTTGGNATYTLPDATVNARLSFQVRVVLGGNVATFDDAGGANVNGALTWTPAAGYYLVWSDGTDWQVW